MEAPDQLSSTQIALAPKGPSTHDGHDPTFPFKLNQDRRRLNSRNRHLPALATSGSGEPNL
jgi:hypothetical protein